MITWCLKREEEKKPRVPEKGCITKDEVFDGPQKGSLAVAAL